VIQDALPATENQGFKSGQTNAKAVPLGLIIPALDLFPHLQPIKVWFHLVFTTFSHCTNGMESTKKGNVMKLKKLIDY